MSDITGLTLLVYQYVQMDIMLILRIVQIVIFPVNYVQGPHPLAVIAL